MNELFESMFVLICLAGLVATIIYGIRKVRTASGKRLKLPILSPEDKIHFSNSPKIDGSKQIINSNSVQIDIDHNARNETIHSVRLDERSIKIGSNLNFPMTLTNISEEDAERICDAIKSLAVEQNIPWLTNLIAKNNIECEEVTQWAQYAEKYISQYVSKKLEAVHDLDTYSKLDRDDLVSEFENEAIENLPIRPWYVGTIETLVFNKPKDFTVDDKLIEKFNGETAKYEVYLQSLGYSGNVIKVSPDNPKRKLYEDLANEGYLLRGKQIPLELIIGQMTLKEMQEITDSDHPKKFTRKKQAISFLMSLPDIEERLDNKISFRELFMVNSTPDISTAELRQSFTYAQTLARVVFNTLRKAYDNTNHDSTTGLTYYVDAGDCCVECKSKYHGKVITSRSKPTDKPPYHIDCSSWITIKNQDEY